MAIDPISYFNEAIGVANETIANIRQQRQAAQKASALEETRTAGFSVGAATGRGDTEAMRGKVISDIRGKTESARLQQDMALAAEERQAQASKAGLLFNLGQLAAQEQAAKGGGGGGRGFDVSQPDCREVELEDGTYWICTDPRTGQETLKELLIKKTDKDYEKKKSNLGRWLTGAGIGLMSAGKLIPPVGPWGLAAKGKTFLGGVILSGLGTTASFMEGDTPGVVMGATSLAIPGGSAALKKVKGLFKGIGAAKTASAKLKEANAIANNPAVKEKAKNVASQAAKGRQQKSLF